MAQAKTSSTFTVTVTAVFTALVCAATIIFSMYVPSTESFFNNGAIVFRKLSFAKMVRLQPK